MRTLSYRYAVDALAAGSSLGNLCAFARLSRETDLKGLWSSLDDEYYAGDWTVDLTADGTPFTPETTAFSPEAQSTRYRAGDVSADKLFFIPFLTAAPATPSPLQSAGLLILFDNRSARRVECIVRHRIVFPARACDLFTKQPPPGQAEKRMNMRPLDRSIEILTRGRPHEARIVGSPVPWSSWSGDDVTLTLEHRLLLEPHASAELPLTFAFSPEGAEAALAVYHRCLDLRGLLGESRRAYADILSRTEIWTPEPVINRGLQWSKVNTVRVEHRYRIGEGFTNDPPQDIVVVRDLAWFVLGSDYLTPEFSRALLALAGRYAYHADGKLTEYIHADQDPPELHDYGLNINDDTPLYVYALYHHAVTAGDGSLLRTFYPLMARACDHILAQISDGLVRCTAGGTGVRGICGWRNIIDGYNLSGAVTEVNAECFAALALTAEAARIAGREEDSRRLREAAGQLRAAMNERLVSSETGLYLLNLDNQNVPHHDVTGDLIFPVMFGVADPAMSRRILDTLTGPDFWTPDGSHTVSRREHNYDPDFGYQLVGGLWHNLTAWTAYCLRTQAPETLVEGMRNIYRCCEPDRPADRGFVVPGEFPERLHGETAVSRGMAMSPWMPPTYLWLGVEGLLGVGAAGDECSMNPAIPAAWDWVAVKNLLWRGESVTAFLHGGVLYATRPLKTSRPFRLGSPVPSSASSEELVTIAMRVGGEIMLFAACDTDCAATVTVDDGSRVIRHEISLRGGKATLVTIPAGARTMKSSTSPVSQ